jgi:endonuclease/exonuclease/phosphatase family metal-dependent hydrolase
MDSNMDDSNFGQAFRLATLNSWHGLAGGRRFLFDALESQKAHRERLERQVDSLAALNAQVIFLQEVNPLPVRAFWFAEKLKMRVFFATANQGMKLLWGPPFNLNEGIAILVPSTWHAELLGKQLLSGNQLPSLIELPGELGSFLSCQLTELRVAMAVRLHFPDNWNPSGFYGTRSILLVNTHFHHGHWGSPANLGYLNDLVSSGYLKPRDSEKVLTLFRQSNTRRVAEAQRLTQWINRIARPGEAVILGGDLNTEPESLPVQEVRKIGFRDTWDTVAHSQQQGSGHTWDPARNMAAFRSQTYHRYAQKYGRGIAALYKKAELVPRRIDFIFDRAWNYAHAESASVSEPSEQQPLGVMGALDAVDMFPEPDKSPKKQIISDHFGLCATYRRD